VAKRSLSQAYFCPRVSSFTFLLPSMPSSTQDRRSLTELESYSQRRSTRIDASAANVASFTIDAEETCEECANAFKASGSAPCSLMGAEYGQAQRPEDESEERASFLFAMEIDRKMQKEDPSWKVFWTSHKGTIIQFLLIFVYMHFDAGLPILQELYKKYYGQPTMWNDVQRECPSYTDGATCKLHHCSWIPEKSTCFEKAGLLYTKQTLLITQNFCEICCIFLMARYLRGSFKDCLNLRKTIKFAPAGCCFGIQAVFGFFAMEEMGADAYSLYAQGSIIVLTIVWSIIFRVRLSGPVWMGVIMIVVGMVGFNMSDATTSSKGLMFIGFKIVTQCFACIYAELFMKTDPEVLYIQMAWIKPVELMITIVMTYVMSTVVQVKNVLYFNGIPKEVTALEAINALGFYHHWSWLTVVIMVFNMGDTFMTATVAKKFDSVVKGVAGVADIIYPTQFLMFFINKPSYTPLMIISGITIILGAFNFVLAKAGMRRTQQAKDELASLKLELEKTKGYSTAA